MNSRFFFIVILFCLIVTTVSYPAIRNDLVSLPKNVVSFYSDAGNLYLNSMEESLLSTSNLLRASAYFYSPLPVETVFSYIRFGEVLINAGEMSVNGLASIGSLVTSGADKVIFFR